MLILLGPSASGKTESAKIMINRYPISKVVTGTTRKKRLNEIDGFDYHFFTKKRFKELEKTDYFVETAKYGGNYYGTPRNELGDNKLIILEPQGLKSFLKLQPCDIVAIYLKTKESVRIQRMKARRDNPEDIKARIASDRIDFDLNEIEGLDMIIETSDKTLSEIADIIYKNYIELLKQKKCNNKGVNDVN